VHGTVNFHEGMLQLHSLFSQGGMCALASPFSKHIITALKKLQHLLKNLEGLCCNFAAIHQEGMVNLLMDNHSSCTQSDPLQTMYVIR
jgi:hypothetical protein